MIKVSSFFSVCEQGKRDNQEDFIIPKIAVNDERIFVLCDGMGGHSHGEIASQVVAESVYEFLKLHASVPYKRSALQEALNVANKNLILADVFDDEKKMGTTIVVAIINIQNILLGHVGDSRCYVLDKDFNIKFRTKDHSVVEEALSEGIITEEEAFTSSRRNVITRCVTSAQEYVVLDIDEFADIQNGDYLFLCSDGVDDTLQDKEISEALFLAKKSSNPLSIIEEVCSSKSKDNYSAMLVELLKDDDIQEEKNKDGMTESYSVINDPIEDINNDADSDIIAYLKLARKKIIYVIDGTLDRIKGVKKSIK